MYAIEKQDFTPYVNEVMAIDDITLGNCQGPLFGSLPGDEFAAIQPMPMTDWRRGCARRELRRSSVRITTPK